MSNRTPSSAPFFEVPEDMVNLLGPEGQHIRTWNEWIDFLGANPSLDTGPITLYVENENAREAARRNAATNTSNTAQVPLTNGISSGSGSGNNHAHHHPNANTNRTTSNINSGPSSMSRHSQGYLYPFPGLGRVSNSSLQRRFNLTRQSSGPSNPTTTAQANSTPYSQAYLSSRHTSTTNHVAPFARAAGPGTDNRDTSEPLVHDEEGDVEMTEEGDVEMMDV